MGPEYPGEGAAQTTVAVSIIDDFCIIQAKIASLGLLLVPIHRDTQINYKTEKGSAEKGNRKKKKKIQNQEKKEAKGQKLMKLSVRGYRQCPFIGTPRSTRKLKREVWSRDTAKKRRK